MLDQKMDQKMDARRWCQPLRGTCAWRLRSARICEGRCFSCFSNTHTY